MNMNAMGTARDISSSPIRRQGIVPAAVCGAGFSKVEDQ
jgi:hypothetical protein